MNTLISSCWFLPIVGLIVGLILIGLGLMVYIKSKQTYARRDNLEREFSLEISNSKFKYQGTIGGVLVAGGVLIAALSIYFLLTKDCDKKGKNNASVGVNVNANTNIQITLVQLQEKLDRGVNDPQYEIKRYPNREVVKGKVGKYYIIDLKDADSKVLILFNLGKYTKDEFDRLFLNAMSKVKEDVFSQLDAGKISYRIYVRGSADIVGDKRPSIGKLLEGDSREITYLVKNPNNPNQYLQESQTQIVPKDFANKHLPNLRAAYIQDKLKDLDLSCTILDGSVTQREGEQDRNALILLYWPE
jgi:hypothetical protein